MKISDIHIDGFGVWSGLDIESLPPQVTLFYGPNEAGKTTLMQFCRTVLYGFSAERRNRYLPPANGGRAGGKLMVSDGLGQFVVSRHTLPSELGEQPGQIAVLDADGNPLSPERLRVLLSGVDETTFNHVFAIGLREIQELSTLHDSAAGDLLYRLTSGMDRVSLGDVGKEVTGGRELLWSKVEKQSLIRNLHDRKRALQADIDRQLSGVWRWSDLAAQRDSLSEEAERLENNIDGWETDLGIVEALWAVREPWNQRADLDRRLAGLGNVKQVSEEDVLKIEQLDEQVRQVKHRRRVWGKRAKKLRAEGTGLVVNRNLLKAASRIDALGEHSTWITTLEAQVDRLNDEIRKIDAEIASQVGQINIPGAQRIGGDGDYALRVVTTLRVPAKSLKSAHERLENAKREAEEFRRQAESVSNLAETRVGVPRGMDLTRALQEAGNRVSLLRKRIELEEQLDRLGRERDELEDDIDYWTERTVMPGWLSMMLGLGFVIGIGLLLSGILGGWMHWFNSPAPLIFVGAVLSLGVGGIKLHLEQTAAAELYECRRQFDIVRKQHAHARDEQQAIDDQLPGGGGALDVRLRGAEQELKELERLAPLESQRTGSFDRSEAALRLVADATSGLEEARNRWRAALKSVGLPEEFDPEALRFLSSQGNDLADLRKRRDLRREELELRERDLLTLAARVEQVYRDLNLQPESERPQLQLQHLFGALTRERETAKQRVELAVKVRGFLKKRQQAAIRARRAVRHKHAILAKAGVTRPEDLRRLVGDANQLRILTQQREDLTQKIMNTLADRCTEEAAANRIIKEGGKLEGKREELQKQIASARIRLAEIHELRGAHGQEMNMLASDRRLDQARFELAIVEEQLERAAQEWQKLALLEGGIHALERLYQNEKQPLTLREASRYLEQLTLGVYRRIWTPVAERTLKVDNDKGESLPVEKLSRGTREAVFLALRLALCDQYRERGVCLPMVLDDVLVNFDSTRAKAAVQVLKDFSKRGQQVLFFTCHEHIMQWFQDAGIAIRTLPARHKPSLPLVQPLPIVPEEEPVAVLIETPKQIFEEPKKRRRKPPQPERIDPPEVITPPRNRVILAPAPPQVDPNVLLQKAAAEEIWYDPVGILPQESFVAVQELAPPISPPRVEPERKPPSIRNKRRRRQRFTWESPERYVEDEE